ncbi:MAG: adenylyl-sulfate kinase [Myxococcales bacterium]|nr:adenylyl-sulfate kinase [Myxococcales bacterium]
MKRERSIVLWIVGRPGAGKSTLASHLIDVLERRDRTTLWLDSDDLRAVLTPQPTYDDEERAWFYGVVAHLAYLGERGGAFVVISATAPRQAFRDALRKRCPRFVEVYLKCDEAILRRRDPRSLYAASDTGEVTLLPGVGAPFEEPAHPEICLDSGRESAALLVDHVMRWIDAAFPGIAD